MMKKIMIWINSNHKKCLFTLIITSCINIVSGIMAISCCDFLAISSLLSYLFSLYAISNLITAKHGRLCNMHIIRQHWLRKHNKENDYQESCLKYVVIMLPITIAWSAFNLLVLIIKMIL